MARLLGYAALLAVLAVLACALIASVWSVAFQLERAFNANDHGVEGNAFRLPLISTEDAGGKQQGEGA